MKRLALIALLALGACARSPTITLSTDVTMNTLQGVISTYGVALSAERSYKTLPLCRTGTVATFLAPCAQRSIVVRLQAADRRANAAINQAVDFVRRYPTVDASNAINAAGTAVSDLQNLLQASGVN